MIAHCFAHFYFYERTRARKGDLFVLWWTRQQKEERRQEFFATNAILNFIGTSQIQIHSHCRHSTVLAST